jgi:hypothetical protein
MLQYSKSLDRRALLIYQLICADIIGNLSFGVSPEPNYLIGEDGSDVIDFLARKIECGDSSTDALEMFGGYPSKWKNAGELLNLLRCVPKSYWTCE